MDDACLFREDNPMKCIPLGLIFISVLAAQSSLAQARRVRQESTGSRPTFTYDIGASSGTYNGNTYNEINLGLNWQLNEYFVWRNAAFHRFGTRVDSASGLDTSARFVFNADSDSGLGIGLFAGPGFRISNKENTGVFGEAGATVKAGGLKVGVGVKSITYSNPGENSDGTQRTKTDTTVFIILAGGGAF